MSAQTRPLPLPQDPAEVLDRLPLGAWISNGTHAFQVVARWPSTGEITLRGEYGTFRSAASKTAEYGYRIVRRKPRRRGRR